MKRKIEYKWEISLDLYNLVVMKSLLVHSYQNIYHFVSIFSKKIIKKPYKFLTIFWGNNHLPKQNFCGRNWNSFPYFHLFPPYNANWLIFWCLTTKNLIIMNHFWLAPQLLHKCCFVGEWRFFVLKLKWNLKNELELSIFVAQLFAPWQDKERSFS